MVETDIHAEGGFRNAIVTQLRLVKLFRAGMRGLRVSPMAVCRDGIPKGRSTVARLAGIGRCARRPAPPQAMPTPACASAGQRKPAQILGLSRISQSRRPLLRNLLKAPPDRVAA
ncbi:hypothetical protein LRS73_34235 (plasmid) [Methylobacterium currus]|uniref:hypothetical protein n=1 Tax=Methylobacterium currus TaxID=2051553 RepID=UPI001E2FBF91|nr:hypothetical protein [Methylobacterium currus]UHC20027.1 hypothetical protein LRS73_34235 [Methylobacterium currus]